MGTQSYGIIRLSYVELLHRPSEWRTPPTTRRNKRNNSASEFDFLGPRCPRAFACSPNSSALHHSHLASPGAMPGRRRGQSFLSGRRSKQTTGDRWVQFFLVKWTIFQTFLSCQKVDADLHDHDVEGMFYMSLTEYLYMMLCLARLAFLRWSNFAGFDATHSLWRSSIASCSPLKVREDPSLLSFVWAAQWSSRMTFWVFEGIQPWYHYTPSSEW